MLNRILSPVLINLHRPRKRSIRSKYREIRIGTDEITIYIYILLADMDAKPALVYTALCAAIDVGAAASEKTSGGKGGLPVSLRDGI